MRTTLKHYPLLDSDSVFNIVKAKTQAHENLRQLILILNGMIEDNYYGGILIKFECGEIVVAKKEETLKF